MLKISKNESHRGFAYEEIAKRLMHFNMLLILTELLI